MSIQTVSVRGGNREESYLDITSPSIEVQVQVFDLSIFCKLVCDVLFCSFLMDVRDHYYPPFDSWEKTIFSEPRVARLEREERTSCGPRLRCGLYTVELLISCNSALVPACDVDEKQKRKREVNTYQSFETHDPCGGRHLRCLGMIISQRPHLSVRTDPHQCSFHLPTSFLDWVGVVGDGKASYVVT